MRRVTLHKYHHQCVCDLPRSSLVYLERKSSYLCSDRDNLQNLHPEFPGDVLPGPVLLTRVHEVKLEVVSQVLVFRGVLTCGRTAKVHSDNLIWIEGKVSPEKQKCFGFFWGGHDSLEQWSRASMERNGYASTIIRLHFEVLILRVFPYFGGKYCAFT